MQALDRDALLWVVGHRTGWLDPVFVGLSLAGYGGLLWIGLAAGLAAWHRLRIVPFAALAAACVWSADVLTLLLKAVVERPRPFRALPQVDPLLHGTLGASFPSGHAATSFAGATFLALAAPRLAPALFALAAAVAYSRVYVGVHYPLDVVAGAVLGAAVTLVFRALGPRAGALLRAGALRRPG